MVNFEIYSLIRS